MENNINTLEDLYVMLDSQVTQIPWNEFYSQRERPAPFILQNELPDENLVKLIDEHPHVKAVLEAGCGEGRNAIYMAGKGMDVTAVDISHEAIHNAIKIAESKGIPVNFRCEDLFHSVFMDHSYDLVYDSGLFHHLAPHRRLSYLSLLTRVLKIKGYFALTCFAWGDHCADEVDDWEFYKSHRRAVAFTENRLKEFFGTDFDVLEIRKYQDGIPNTIQGLHFLWVCLFQKK